MIRTLVLDNYKCFEHFEVTFHHFSTLVGPNNAGKSTIISALRAVAAMVRYARFRRPPASRPGTTLPPGAYPISPSQTDLQSENLRYNFRPDLTTQIRARFDNGVMLHATWPAENADRAAYYFFRGPGEPRAWSIDRLRESLPNIAVIPILTPLEQRESLLTTDYVRSHLSTRLASRHFRNQLLILRNTALGPTQTLDDFLRYTRNWLNEIILLPPEIKMTAESTSVDLFYREGRIQKEIAWAGDGIQVYVQLLLHLFRAYKFRWEWG